MMRKPYVYEGRVQVFDVEPGVSGDVLKLVDDPRAEEFRSPTLDEEFQRWWGKYISCGPAVGPVRITIEEL